MNLDHERCYAAIQSRDARFDGRFYTAVLTTGIFCRPVCPARTPRPQNVRFYATAAAASEAGFRPCLRCRPELSPDSTGWNEQSATVSRALSMIAAGAMDEGGVEGLAGHLHLSGRQLRRYFEQELGASPVTVAQTRRLLFAKQLISETSLPMTEVAFAAGYGSVRRFNDAVLKTYSKSPTELRSHHIDAGPAGTDADQVELTLRYRPPYAWKAVLNGLRQRAVPGVELVEGNSYRRTVQIDGIAGSIAVTAAPASSCVRLAVPMKLARSLRPLVERTKRVFDLSAAPDAIAGHLGRDPLLAARLQQHPGMRLPGAWDPFEGAVYAALAHGEELRTGRAFCRRLVEEYGTPTGGYEELGRGPLHLFPTPEQLAGVDLGRIGLPVYKQVTVQQLAAAFADGRLSFGGTESLESLLDCLQSVGVERDLAQHIALQAFHEPDAFPLKPVASVELTPDELAERSESWRPWRGYAATLLTACFITD